MAPNTEASIEPWEKVQNEIFWNVSFDLNIFQPRFGARFRLKDSELKRMGLKQDSSNRGPNGQQWLKPRKLLLRCGSNVQRFSRDNRGNFRRLGRDQIWTFT